jgi:hypothetical protein
MSWPKTEQEDKIQEIFDDLERGFKKLDKTSDEAKKQAMLKDLTNKLKDAKSYVRGLKICKGIVKCCTNAPAHSWDAAWCWAARDMQRFCWSHPNAALPR